MSKNITPKTFTFAVRGRGGFPFDMLRYDQCWPAAQSDVNAMHLMGDRVVYLASARSFSPTLDRWKSFGWELVEDD